MNKDKMIDLMEQLKSKDICKWIKIILLGIVANQVLKYLIIIGVIIFFSMKMTKFDRSLDQKMEEFHRDFYQESEFEKNFDKRFQKTLEEHGIINKDEKSIIRKDQIYDRKKLIDSDNNQLMSELSQDEKYLVIDGLSYLLGCTDLVMQDTQKVLQEKNEQEQPSLVSDDLSYVTQRDIACKMLSYGKRCDNIRVTSIISFLEAYPESILNDGISRLLAHDDYVMIKRYFILNNKPAVDIQEIKQLFSCSGIQEMPSNDTRDISKDISNHNALSESGIEALENLEKNQESQ